jgi:hypothetical protein
MVATYATGKWAVDLHTVKLAFPKASGFVRINTNADPSYGDCLDVENGDATVEDIDTWLHARAEQGVTDLATYCSRDTLPAVQAATSLSPYHWVATLDGTLFIQGYQPLVGPAAVQILPATLIGPNVDLSIVLEDSWHSTG